MYCAVLSAAAAERLGYHPYPAPTAANSVPYDGRPACNNCGFCAFFACPSTPRAIRSPCCSERFSPAAPNCGRTRSCPHRAKEGGDRGRHGSTRRGRATMTPVTSSSPPAPWRPRALLLLSGFEHRLIGRSHLMVHFQTMTFATCRASTPREAGPSPTSTTTSSCGRRPGPAAREAGSLDAWRHSRARRPGSPDSRGDLLSVGGRAQGADAHLSLRDHLAGFTMQGEDLPQLTNRTSTSTRTSRTSTGCRSPGPPTTPTDTSSPPPPITHPNSRPSSRRPGRPGPGR